MITHKTETISKELEIKKREHVAILEQEVK